MEIILSIADITTIPADGTLPASYEHLGLGGTPAPPSVPERDNGRGVTPRPLLSVADQPL